MGSLVSHIEGGTQAEGSLRGMKEQRRLHKELFTYTFPKSSNFVIQQLDMKQV
jgi:hypothetical protein